MSDQKPIVPGTDPEDDDRDGIAEDPDDVWANAVIVEHDPDDDVALHPALVCACKARRGYTIVAMFDAEFCDDCGLLVP